MRASISMFVLSIARNTPQNIKKEFTDVILVLTQKSQVLLSEVEISFRRVMSSRKRAINDVFFSF